MATIFFFVVSLIQCAMDFRRIQDAPDPDACDNDVTEGRIPVCTFALLPHLLNSSLCISCSKV